MATVSTKMNMSNGIAAGRGHDSAHSKASAAHYRGMLNSKLVSLKGSRNMDTANCPVCGDKITFETNVEFMDRRTCPTCSALLEVVGIDPLELDWIYYDEYYDTDEKAHSKTLRVAKCPLCREDVHLGSQARVGSRVLCPGCDAQLEIVSLYPAELDSLYDGGYESYYQDDDIYEEYYDDPLN